MRFHSSVTKLSVAHFWVDVYSSMLGAFLPFLLPRLGLSMTEAGLLGGTLILSGSFFQPVYGYLADAWQKRFFTVLAPAAAGCFISTLGLATGFWSMTALVFLGGVAIGAFHPQGTATASTSSRRRPGLHLSVFITAGMVGYALGPSVITGLIATIGLEWCWVAAIPGVLVSVYLWKKGPPAPAPLHRAKLRLEDLRAESRVLLLLFFLVVIRAALQLVLVAFLPLYLTERGWGVVAASQTLTLFLLVGGAAGFLGGMMADRASGRAVILISMVGTLPALIGFLWTDGWLSLLLCLVGGFFLMLTLTVNVSMAQRLVPQGASTVSALMMGLAWGVGGIAVPIIGRFGDLFSLQSALLALTLLCGPGILLALALPAHFPRIVRVVKPA